MKESEIVIEHLKRICKLIATNIQTAYDEYNEFYKTFNITSIPNEETDYFIEQCRILLNTNTLELQKIYVYTAVIQITKEESFYTEFIY